MKRWIFYILIFAGLLPSACVIEHHDSYRSGTNGGKQAFEAYENNMQFCESLLDLAIRMDRYLAVPENERTEAEDLLFPAYKIRPVGERGWVGMQNRDTVFRIITDGNSLFTEGTEWQVCNASLVCNGAKSFTLKVKGYRGPVWTTDAELQYQCMQDKNPGNYDAGEWMISGKGECASEPDYENKKRILLNFEITQALKKIAESKYVADQGKVALVVRDLYLQQEEKIKAEFDSSSGWERYLKITYKDRNYVYR